MSNAKKIVASKQQLNSSGYDISNFIRVKLPTIKGIKSAVSLTNKITTQVAKNK